MQPPSADRVRVGIVGAGLMGGVHARVFSSDPRAQVVAIVDSDSAAREDLSKRFLCPAFASLAEALSLSNVQLLVVATPPSTHAKLVRQAFDAGVCAFVEKPLCLDIEEARWLIPTSPLEPELYMAENIWFARSWVAGLKQLAGAGPATYFKAVFRTPGPHRPWLWTATEGGLLFDLGSHCIALASLLFKGHMPALAHVSGRLSSLGIFDEIGLQLRYGQAVADCELSWGNASGEVCQFEVHAGGKRVVISLTDEQDGTEADWVVLGGYAEQATAVIDAMLDRAPYPISTSIGVSTIGVAALAKARLEGRRTA
jgi:predicted dehydrogenase